MLRDQDNPTPHLRPGTVCDVDSILKLETISFIRIEEQFSRKQIQRLITNPRAVVVVTVSNDRVVGWAAGLIRRHLRSISGRLCAIAVHPDVRGKGIGKQMVRHIIHSLTELGARRIYLEVNAKNRGAIHLYHKLGFADREYLEDYYGRGYHGIRMMLSTTSDTGINEK
ncbi:MAG: GNAT family N-acetyltransferase [wastewater metagenome]|nr:GNAT family N-acetyltransferase [Candidatus Loosdrechtia aerotolerans]